MTDITISTLPTIQVYTWYVGAHTSMAHLCAHSPTQARVKVRGWPWATFLSPFSTLFFEAEYLTESRTCSGLTWLPAEPLESTISNLSPGLHRIHTCIWLSYGCWDSEPQVLMLAQEAPFLVSRTPSLCFSLLESSYFLVSELIATRASRHAVSTAQED